VGTIGADRLELHCADVVVAAYLVFVYVRDAHVCFRSFLRTMCVADLVAGHSLVML